MDIFLSDSMRPTVCLSYLSVFLSSFLFYCLSVFLYCCLSVFCLFYLSAFSFAFLPFCRSVVPFVYLSVFSLPFCFSIEESGENLHCRLCMTCLRNRLVGGEDVAPPPPPHTGTHSLAGSVTVNAKTTLHYSPGSSCVFLSVWLSGCPPIELTNYLPG